MFSSIFGMLTPPVTTRESLFSYTFVHPYTVLMLTNFLDMFTADTDTPMRSSSTKSLNEEEQELVYSVPSHAPTTGKPSSEPHGQQTRTVLLNSPPFSPVTIPAELHTFTSRYTLNGHHSHITTLSKLAQLHTLDNSLLKMN